VTQPGQLRTDVLEFLERDEVGQRFNPGAWEGAEVQYLNELNAINGPILRQHVFDAFRESTHKGITYSLVWGYPSGRTYAGTENDTNLKGALRNPQRLVDAVDSLIYASRNALETVKRLNRQPGLGIASTTKVAYFAQLETGAGKCLIFDRQVTKASLTLDYPELADFQAELRSLYAKRKTNADLINVIAQASAAYPIYLDHAYKLARVIGRGVTGDEVERFLFERGREIG